jgi:hypothetical protein
MKSVFIIAIVLVAMIGVMVPSVFAEQSGMSLTATAIEGGNVISLNGLTTIDGTVSIMMLNDNYEIIYLDQLTPDANGKFSNEILVGGPYWKEDGMLEIRVQPNENGCENCVTVYVEVINGMTAETSTSDSSILSTQSNETINEIIVQETVVEKQTPSEVIEKSKFKKYSNNKYNFSLEYPAEIDSHFKGVDSIPMIWKNSPHPELPEFKVWKKVNTIPEGLFATTYEFKVFSDNGMSEYSQSELLNSLENYSINLFTDMCSPENCTVVKTDSNISTNGNGAKILDMIVQTVTDYEKGVTQYITNSMRITILNANNDVLMIQHITSSSDNFTHLFYEHHFTHMIKSLETQYIPKGSLKNTSTIFTAYGETVVTPEGGGGCLIATATYGSELAPQVQQLRELRDNQLLNTESGTAFMGMFNDIYYSFSPTIADMEREHPLFKEAVKLAIIPMISSLSLMENAESESEVLSIGISVIALNLGMYLGVPAIVVIGIRKITHIN